MMSNHQPGNASDPLAAIEARYAEMIAGSKLIVVFHPGRKDPTGWHWVTRIWPAHMNCKPARIGHARHKVNAETIADEFRALDQLALGTLQARAA